VKKFKILFLSSVDFNSAYSGTLYFIKALMQLGYDPEIIVLTNSADHGFYNNEFRDIRILRKYSSKSVLHNFITAYRLIFIVSRSLSSDVIIFNEGYFLRLLKFLRLIKPSLKVVQYCQDLWYSKDHPWSRQAKLFDRFSKVPDIVVEVEANRALMRKKLFGLDRTPFVLINTMPLDRLPAVNRSGALSELAGVSLPAGLPRIIYSGGSGTEKPFNRLIDIMSKVRGKHFFLAIINRDPAEIIEFEEYAARKLDRDSYKLVPAVTRERLIEALWEADVGLIDYTYSVQPTYNQKYCAPTKLFEYMGSGLAIAGSNNESLRQTIEKNGIGYCANDDSVISFAQKIDLIIAEKGELNLMKERSRRLFTETYCYEKSNYPVVREILSILEA
jgi:glycosyltransferase involved in cell wall biosynthesis